MRDVYLCFLQILSNIIYDIADMVVQSFIGPIRHSFVNIIAAAIRPKIISIVVTIFMICWQQVSIDLVELLTLSLLIKL